MKLCKNQFYLVKSRKKKKTIELRNKRRRHHRYINTLVCIHFLLLFRSIGNPRKD